MSEPKRRPTLPILDPATIDAVRDAVIARSRSDFDALAKDPRGNVFERWDDLVIDLEDIGGPLSILESVHPDRLVREHAGEALIAISNYETEIYQREDLFSIIRDAQPSNEYETRLRKDLLDNFEDNGIALPPEKRARFKEISDRLANLSQEFESNVRENDSKLRFTPDEYRGVPESFLRRVGVHDDGSITIGFDPPDYNTFMANAVDGAARRRYYVAFMNRGGTGNVRILNEIVGLRREIASLYDLPSFAHYIVRRRMAETPDRVASFLDEVETVVREVEQRDIDDLRALKAEMEGTPPAETPFDWWDLPFYRERLRERRYAVDQEEMRRYFPTEEVTRWILATAAEIYGVRFHSAWVPTWHEDVRYYDVIDGENGERLGGIYLDLFPREGKYKHAAAWPVRGVSSRTGRTPISVLVTNFDRRGLTHQEVETYFHELGHVLHGVLSRSWFTYHAGTGVERDFVEAPSQMFEEWARRVESLSRLRDQNPDIPPIERDLVERLEAARLFGRGIHYARQHLYASYDMRLAGPEPGDVLEVWREMEGETPLGHVDGTAFPAAFGHIAAGYAAGYYGYMWSEAIAMDLLDAFGDDLLDSGVGGRFRREILGPGGQVTANAMVEHFLGRPATSDAFFRMLRGE